MSQVPIGLLHGLELLELTLEVETGERDCLVPDLEHFEDFGAVEARCLLVIAQLVVQQAVRVDQRNVQ